MTAFVSNFRSPIVLGCFLSDFMGFFFKALSFIYVKVLSVFDCSRGHNKILQGNRLPHLVCMKCSLILSNRLCRSRVKSIGLLL